MKDRESEQHVTAEQVRQVMDVLHPCMDDYLYVLDIKHDYYSIAPGAQKRFRMEKAEFSHATEKFREFIYPDDYDMLCRDLEQIGKGQKEFHNLQYRWMDQEGDPVWINCRGHVLRDEDGQPEYLIGCINEIARKKKADNVSGLLGEFSLQKELEEREAGRLNGFLLMIGLDNFKEINESKGMEYGDMILRKTAQCIQKAVLPDQKLYRVVADKFLIADFHGRNVEDAVILYQEIRDEIDWFIEINRYEVVYTVSVGIVDLARIEDQSYGNLMMLSEFAMNEAKNGGRNRYYIFEEQDYQAFLKKRQLIRMLRHSVNHGFEGFEVHYQPIVDIKKLRLSSAESLLRFCSKEMGFISPEEFIPLLEESGLIIPVGKWVMHMAMEACRKIQEIMPDFRISVNLSYIQVLKSNVLSEILSGVMKYNLKPGSIMIELTESGFLESNEKFLTFCEGLRDHGILLALDDFGTGYSNFRYLYNLSPHTLKIDRSFTEKALQNEYEYNLLYHMADMTRSIHTKFCIEGIETSQELDKICGIGPDYIQGYYFGKPCPYEEFKERYIGRPVIVEDVG